MTVAMPMRDRLREAAMALFAERGFERTTAAEIATRAGVTERTFFRHFADKREVLFDGEAVLREALTAAIMRAPPSQPPLSVLREAFAAIVPLLEDNRAYSVPRQTLIDATPALRERELAKTAALAAALATALERRGVAPLTAGLAAEVGMAAFVRAVTAWLHAIGPGLSARLDETFAALASLSSPAQPGGPSSV